MKDMGTGQLYQIAAAPFEAARILTDLPLYHPARRLHGHSFLARAACVGGDEPSVLASLLASCAARLDYSLLNDTLDLPTDQNLAHWLRQCLGLSNTVVGIRSQQDQGAALAQDERTHFWYRFRFEAAHWLPQVAPQHPCGRMHGHGFEVVLQVVESLNDALASPMPSSTDPMTALVAVARSLHEVLDGSCLNDLPGLQNPTSEILAEWIWQRTKPLLPSLAYVTIHETATSSCLYDGKSYHIWKAMYFESALSGATVTKAHASRLLGHSYLLRLYLSAPLDEVMGWTVDYGDVKNLFLPIYAELDHHLLNDLPGLTATDLSNVVCWIRDRATPLLPLLSRIDLFETPLRGISWLAPASDPALVLSPWPTR